MSAWCESAVTEIPIDDSLRSFRASACAGVPPGSAAVAQPSAWRAASVSVVPALCVGESYFGEAPPDDAASVVVVVVGQGAEVKSLADVRRADARSAQICNPDGVTRVFQVSAYKVEPRESVLTRNLLAKND